MSQVEEQETTCIAQNEALEQRYSHVRQGLVNLLEQVTMAISDLERTVHHE